VCALGAMTFSLYGRPNSTSEEKMMALNRWWTWRKALIRKAPVRPRLRRPDNRAFQARFVPRLDMLEGRTLLSVFTVDHLADDLVGSGLNGSLRYAITNAADNDTITFGVTGTINLTGALPDLAHSVSIDGPGADCLTVRRDTGGDYRIFTVDSGTNVVLSGLTITNGVVGRTNGGGILNSGTLTLNNATVSGN